MTTHEIKPLVSAVLEGGNPTKLLQALVAMDREDIYGQSAVRFLMLQDKWDFTPGNEHDQAMDHLFGAFEERKGQSSESYLKATTEIILSLWGVTVESPKWHVSAPVVNKRVQSKVETQVEGKTKKTVRTKKLTPVPTDAQIYGKQDDLKGASDRLKKVIKIQRGS